MLFHTQALCYGYVRHTWRPIKPKEVRQNTHKEALDFATKFRWKWVGNLFCWIYQKSSDYNYELRTFSVKETYE